MSSSSSPPLPPLPTEALSSPPPLSTGSTSTVGSSSTSYSTTSSSPPPLPPSLSNKKSRPFITILHNKSIESEQSPRRSSIATHLMNFASRSTTSLHLLSSSAPVQGSPAAHDIDTSKLTSSGNTNNSSNNNDNNGPAHPHPPPATTGAHSNNTHPHHFNTFPSRASVMPPPRGGASAFSNPFRKLQSSLQLGNKKSQEFGSSPPTTQSGLASLNTQSGQVQQQQQQERERVLSSASSASSMISWRSKGAEMLSKKPWGRARKNSEPTFGKGTAADAGLPIFGANLEDAIRRSHIPGTPMVPAILYRCAEFLEAKGVDEVGLYRVPGSHASVQKLKRQFDTGADHNLLAMDHLDPNDIATLLKLYLRELPSPLLPAVILEQIQSILTTDRHICHTLRGILIRLPRNNYVVLSFLCHHLSRIANHAHKTKMSVSNLGVVFAPTLSIGSVLFKALLGGFYDAAETPESREKGLKIVWGGLLQDFEYAFGDDSASASGSSASGSTVHLPGGAVVPGSTTPAEAYAAEVVNAGGKQELMEDDDEERSSGTAGGQAHPLFILNGNMASSSSSSLLPTGPPPPPPRDLFTHPELRTVTSQSSLSTTHSLGHTQQQQQQQQQQPPLSIHSNATTPTTTMTSMTMTTVSTTSTSATSAEDDEARLMRSMLLAEAAAAASAAIHGSATDEDDEDMDAAVVSTATAVPMVTAGVGGSMATVVTTTAPPATTAAPAVSGLTQAFAAAAAAAAAVSSSSLPPPPSSSSSSTGAGGSRTTVSVAAAEPLIPFIASKAPSSMGSKNGSSKAGSKVGSARTSTDSKRGGSATPLSAKRASQEHKPLLLGEFFFETEDRQREGVAAGGGAGAPTAAAAALPPPPPPGDKEEIPDEPAQSRFASIKTTLSRSSTKSKSPITTATIVSPPSSSSSPVSTTAPQLPPIEGLTIVV